MKGTIKGKQKLRKVFSLGLRPKPREDGAGFWGSAPGPGKKGFLFGATPQTPWGGWEISGALPQTPPKGRGPLGIPFVFSKRGQHIKNLITLPPGVTPMMRTLAWSFVLALSAQSAFAESSICDGAHLVSFDHTHQAEFKGQSIAEDFGSQALFAVDLKAGEIVDLSVQSDHDQHFLMFDWREDCSFKPIDSLDGWSMHHRYLMTAPHDGRFYLRISSTERNLKSPYAITLKKHLPQCGDGLAEGPELWDDGQICTLKTDPYPGQTCENPLVLRGDHLILSFDDFSTHYENRFHRQSHCVRDYNDDQDREFWLDLPLQKGDVVAIWGMMSSGSTLHQISACGVSDCVRSKYLNERRDEAFEFIAKESETVHLLLESNATSSGWIEVERHRPLCGDALISGPEQCDLGPRPTDEGCTEGCKLNPGAGETCETALPIYESLSLRHDKGHPDYPKWLKLGLKKGEILNLTAGSEFLSEKEALRDGCNADSAKFHLNDLHEKDSQGYLHAFAAPKDMILYIDRSQLGEDLHYIRHLSQCGDGQIEGLEECDDRNQISGDGCDSACQVEPGWFCPKSEKGSACIEGLLGDGKTVETAFQLQSQHLRLAGEQFDLDFEGQKPSETATAYIALKLQRGEGFELDLQSGRLNAELLLKGQERPILYAADYQFDYEGTGRKQMRYRATNDQEDLLLKIQSALKFKHFLWSSWKRMAHPPYAITLDRLPRDEAYEERERALTAFLSDDGPERRAITLKGDHFAEDFAAPKDSACALLTDPPNAQFELWLEPGEHLSVSVECTGEICPIPSIEVSACTQKEGCPNTQYRCGLFEGLGYSMRFHPKGQSYTAKKREKIRIEIAPPILTRNNFETEFWSGYAQPNALYTTKLDRPYQIRMIRNRGQRARLPLGQNPKKPLVAQFDQDGKAVIQGDDFAEDFATPKNPQLKIDRKMPWMPSAFVAVDLKAGEKLKAKSSMGHYALVRISKNAEWISDDWSPYHQEEDQSKEMERKEQLKLPLEYQASKDERIYFVVSPETHCIALGCKESATNPYLALKGLPYYTPQELRKEASDFSEGERYIFMQEYKRCDKRSCGIQNQGPYRFELWKE